jgi:hypothetical protein
LLYAPKFSVYAGMDELVWCQIVVMPLVRVHADAKPSVPEDEHYSIVWGSILSAVDETLREHKSEVLSIADELERTGTVEHVWLAQAVAGVQPRQAEPLVPCDEYRITPGDPLA